MFSTINKHYWLVLQLTIYLANSIEAASKKQLQKPEAKSNLHDVLFQLKKRLMKTSIIHKKITRTYTKINSTKKEIKQLHFDMNYDKKLISLSKQLAVGTLKNPKAKLGIGRQRSPVLTGRQKQRYNRARAQRAKRALKHGNGLLLKAQRGDL